MSYSVPGIYTIQKAGDTCSEYVYIQPYNPVKGILVVHNLRGIAQTPDEVYTSNSAHMQTSSIICPCESIEQARNLYPELCL